MFGITAAALTANAAADRPHLGAQTNAWTIRNFDGLLDVLQKMRGYGYEGFETGYRNVESQFSNPDARAKIAASGLRFFGVHIWQEKDQYDPATRIAPESLYRRVAEGASRLNAEHMILSGWPYDSLSKKIEALHAAGKFGQSLHLPVLYHNEYPEFANGRTEMDELIRGTDPSLLNFILDAGHCFRAGADPVAFFRKHHTRLAAMHLRDFIGDEQVPLGQGKFPLAALARAVRDTKWSGWLMNEEERVGSRPGDAAIAPAHEVLVKTFGGAA